MRIMKSTISLVLLLTLLIVGAAETVRSQQVENTYLLQKLFKPAITLQNEISGESAVIDEQGNCKPFDLVLDSRRDKNGVWEVCNLDFRGQQTPAGYTVVLDVPIPEGTSHIFTASEKGVTDLAVEPTVQMADYGVLVFATDVSCVLPLVSLFDEKNNKAVTIALAPDENIPHLQIGWHDAKTLRLTMKHRGIGKNRTSPLKIHLTTHPADYRSAIAAYAQTFPEWFEPVMPTGKIDGAFWYHHILRHPDFEELRRQNIRYIWSSFWFTHLGEYLPNETEWSPYTYSEKSIFPITGEKMSDRKINAFIEKMNREDIGVFAYFNVTEYGGKGGADGDPVEANRILREQFADALIKNRSGNPIPTWEGAMGMNAGKHYSLWPFLEDQIKRHLARLPKLTGFLIDRLDWASILDYAHDDGLTMDGDKPAENMALVIAKAVERVCDLTHAAQKRVYVNQFTRVEPVKNTDGYCHEMDFLALEYLSPFKPSAAWFLQHPYSGPENAASHEAQLKRRLKIALFPQLIAHEFPVSQQSPDPVAADLNEMFTPLFAPFVGKRQVLLPQCVSVTGDNECNLFTDQNGCYLVPLISRSKFVSLGNRETEPVAITLNVPDANELTWVHVIPLAEKPYRAEVKLQDGKTIVSLSRHGAASMIIVGKGQEPDIGDRDEIRLAAVRDRNFPPTVSPSRTWVLTPEGKIRSAKLALSGRHFYHHSPFAVSVNGVSCGRLLSDSGEFSVSGLDEIGDVMTVTLDAADTGAWWFPRSARLIVQLEDGSEHVAVYDSIAGNSTPTRQILNLKWTDGKSMMSKAAFAGKSDSGNFGATCSWFPGDPKPEPDRFQLNVAGRTHVWAENVDDDRLDGRRRASCWHAVPRLTGEVIPTDPKEEYRLTIFSFDFDHVGRAYHVRIKDPFGKVLDTRDVTLNDIEKGVYLTWIVSGEIRFEFELAPDSRNDANATISGIMLD